MVRTAEDAMVKEKKMMMMMMMTGTILENPEGFVREIHRKMGGRAVRSDC
jgi:hypothetical protein